MLLQYIWHTIVWVSWLGISFGWQTLISAMEVISQKGGIFSRDGIDPYTLDRGNQRNIQHIQHTAFGSYLL